jgi:hypothetical protein
MAKAAGGTRRGAAHRAFGLRRLLASVQRMFSGSGRSAAIDPGGVGRLRRERLLEGQKAERSRRIQGSTALLAAHLDGKRRATPKGYRMKAARSMGGRAPASRVRVPGRHRLGYPHSMTCGTPTSAARAVN